MSGRLGLSLSLLSVHRLRRLRLTCLRLLVLLRVLAYDAGVGGRAAAGLGFADLPVARRRLWGLTRWIVRGVRDRLAYAASRPLLAGASLLPHLTALLAAIHGAVVTRIPGPGLLVGGVVRRVVV